MVDHGRLSRRGCLRRLVLVLAVLAGGGSAEAQPAPPANGAINTIVYNAASGRNAEGMTVELFEVKGEAFQRLSVATTGADGRADLLSGRPLAVGQYELRFQVTDYFLRQAVQVSDPPFLDYVPVRFWVGTPSGHYHVPLICTPWSYSTYRGS